MRVALVYDRVNKFGGAERVLLALHEIWPDAPLYTTVYNPKTALWAADFDVRTSFLQKIPLAKTTHEFYPWLAPLAFESFNFDEFDVVISITSAEAKGIITKPETAHICYCLTPTRYLWSGYHEYFRSPASKFLSSPVVAYLRVWDQIAAKRPDVYIAISKNVQRRIKKYYGRESIVIYPPVDTKKFRVQSIEYRVQSSECRGKAIQTPTSSYFLVVSRLVAYKRIDIAIEAFNKLGLPLKIVGTGREEKRLKEIAKKNIEFLGNLTDEKLIGYYQSCQALIFPTEEDFGLAPLEAQACGRPVIAFAGGGALESIIEARSASPSATSSGPSGSGQGPTGEFFYPQTAEALLEKILRYKQSLLSPRPEPLGMRTSAELGRMPSGRMLGTKARKLERKDIRILREKFRPENCRKNAERFNKEVFKENFKKFVGKCTK